MKKSIVINCGGNSSWIGGVYYSKNIAFVLSQNEWITSNYRILLLVDADEEELFNDVDKCRTIKRKKIKNRYVLSAWLTMFYVFNNVKYVYPGGMSKRKKYGVNVLWIPDFQHNHYPDYFSSSENQFRSNSFRTMISSRQPLVLSSNDAMRDMMDFYGKKKNSYVVPFVSYIENEVKKITGAYADEVMSKYNLRRHEYICVCNQFWKHKNHIVVAKAISKLKERGALNTIKFVFTGNLKDNRNPDYYNELKKLVEENVNDGKIIITGFIDRTEQLTIIKNSLLVIQPSLFEGWGTVVEDSKVLDKKILLSDIPVHREQMNGKCLLFNPYDADELADLISKECEIDYEEDIAVGMNSMYERAKLYSEGFERLLKEN